MRTVIIGAVAAGTSAATEIRRQDKDAQIVIYDKDNFISYAGCGMPYYISNEFSDFSQLAPRDPLYFKNKHNIDIFINHEVLSIHPQSKTLTVKNLVEDTTFQDSYDNLVIATGASVQKPEVKGSDKENVFVIRNINHTNNIKSFIENKKPKTAAIIGSGFIGLEMCESFVNLGIKTTIIARSSLAKNLDNNLTQLIESHLKEKGVEVLTNSPIKEITDLGVVLKNESFIKADMVLLATGVKPNVGLAKSIGIELGTTGAIKVDSRMRTNLDNIYSGGDCVELFNVITGKPIYRPLGSTANKTGIIAGNNIAGGNDEFTGILGTGIFRIFDLTVTQTGLTEEEAKNQGFDAVSIIDTKANKPPYMGGKKLTTKAVAERKTGRLLGAQIVGYEGADKRIDVMATAITLGATADDLIHLDLSYSPPYSIPKDPLFYVGIKLKKAAEK